MFITYTVFISILQRRVYALLRVLATSISYSFAVIFITSVSTYVAHRRATVASIFLLNNLFPRTYNAFSLVGRHIRAAYLHTRFRYFKIIFQKAPKLPGAVTINVETLSIDIDCDAITDGDACNANRCALMRAGTTKYECIY